MQLKTIKSKNNGCGTAPCNQVFSLFSLSNLNSSMDLFCLFVFFLHYIHTNFYPPQDKLGLSYAKLVLANLMAILYS